MQIKSISDARRVQHLADFCAFLILFIFLCPSDGRRRFSTVYRPSETRPERAILYCSKRSGNAPVYGLSTPPLDYDESRDRLTNCEM